MFNMKKEVLIAAAVLSTAFFVFSQEKLFVETIVVNIEVPVRVFDGKRFVDNLTIDDFEVYEEGVLQKVEAVYLVKKQRIERSEEKKKFTPKTARNFYLLFEVSDFLPKLGEAIEYFIQDVFYPGDHLTVVTPVKTYRLRDKTFEILSKSDVIQQLRGILRKDTMIGSADYRNAVKELTGLAKSLTAAIVQGGTDANPTNKPDDFGMAAYKDIAMDLQLTMYATLLSKLENLRYVDQEGLTDFTRHLKLEKGQKYVFLFYQREFIPVVEPRILNQYINLYQDRPDILHTISGLFDFYKRDLSLDIDLIKKACSDSSISMHFLYITKSPQIVSGVRMEEHSEDIFSAFREMALATGGYVESSSNPEHLFKKAVASSENYYLLYYSPKSYKRDKKFRNISITVKNRNFRVSHRLGYFAN
jgi:hypothetical protein